MNIDLLIVDLQLVLHERSVWRERENIKQTFVKIFGWEEGSNKIGFTLYLVADAGRIMVLWPRTRANACMENKAFAPD